MSKSRMMVHNTDHILVCLKKNYINSGNTVLYTWLETCLFSAWMMIKKYQLRITQFMSKILRQMPETLNNGVVFSISS